MYILDLQYIVFLSTFVQHMLTSWSARYIMEMSAKILVVTKHPSYS